METFLKTIGTGALVTGMTIANWFGVVPSDYFTPQIQEVETKVVHEYLPAPVQEQLLGGTYVTPDTKALFTTSLASKITSSATSMTLVSATDKDGTTLASSTYGFILDEGTSVEEFVLADCTGTACTNMTRGISVSTATTSVSALQFEHRRGASVKITTAPALVFVMNVLKGKQNIENKLRYNSAQTFVNATDIISKDYADSLSFGGIPEATETASGFVEIATGLETASSSSSGSVARLAIPASLATSTYNSATADLKVVVTQNDGKIDGNFIDLNPVTTESTFTATTTLATTTATGRSNIASTSIVTFTGSGTWTKKSNLRYVIVEVVGGGGGGGGNTTAGDAGAGGGGGGYSKEILLASQLGSTETVTVGAGGAGGGGAGSEDGVAGGTTSFGSHLQATGGGLGEGTTGGGTFNGGVGGVGSGGDVNIKGGGGGGGGNNNTEEKPGQGGSSVLGGSTASIGASGGSTGSAYGGGGEGGGFDGGDRAGGTGAAGVVIVTEIYF